MADFSIQDMEGLFKDKPQISFQNDRTIGIYYRDTEEQVDNNLYQMSFYDDENNGNMYLQIIFFKEKIFGGSVQIQNYNEIDINEFIALLTRNGFNNQRNVIVSEVSRNVTNMLENNELRIHIVYKEWIDEKIKNESTIENIIFVNLEKKEYEEFIWRHIIRDFF
jgi:hypothetical protein